MWFASSWPASVIFFAQVGFASSQSPTMNDVITTLCAVRTSSSCCARSRSPFVWNVSATRSRSRGPVSTNVATLDALVVDGVDVVVSGGRVVGASVGATVVGAARRARRVRCCATPAVGARDRHQPRGRGGGSGQERAPVDRHGFGATFSRECFVRGSARHQLGGSAPVASRASRRTLLRPRGCRRGAHGCRCRRRRRTSRCRC